MAATQINRAHLVGVAAGTIVFTNPDASTLAGTISLNKRSLAAAHNFETEKAADEDGDIAGICAGGEFLELRWTFIPYGTSVANATASAAIPKPLASGVISGFPVIPMGSYADGINTATDLSGNSRWIYEGGAELNFEAGIGPASYTMTLRRYPGILSNTAL